MAGGVALGEDGASAESAGHFVSNDDAAQSGGDHGFDGQFRNQRAQGFREQSAELLGVPGMLEHQRALQVLAAVQTAGEAEMSAQVGAGLVEKLEDGVRGSVHQSLL